MTYICDQDSKALARLRVLISTALQNIYEGKFNYDPPPGFCRVRDLTFLPHLLEIGKPTKHITVSELVDRTLGPNYNTETAELYQTIANLREAQQFEQQTQRLQQHLANTNSQPDQPKQNTEGTISYVKVGNGQPSPHAARHPQQHTPAEQEAAPGGAYPCHKRTTPTTDISTAGAAPGGAYPGSATTEQHQRQETTGGALPGGSQLPANLQNHAQDEQHELPTKLIAKLAQMLFDYRCDHKKEQPTGVKHIMTWNVGGWTQPGRAGDEKLKAIKASLRKGPVALQETHWAHEQATRLHTLMPGTHIVSTAATTKNTHPSGGVAVILPVGYEVVTHETILPGQILAVQARTRGAKIRIVSVYLHPDSVRNNMQVLTKYLRTIDLREWTILTGDFNRARQSLRF